MAIIPIPSFPAATYVEGTDLLPIVQSGTDKKATRDELLTASPTSQIEITSTVGGSILLDTTGAIFQESATGQTWGAGDASGNDMFWDGNGNFTINCQSPTPGVWTVLFGAVSYFQCDGSDNVTMQVAGNFYVLAGSAGSIFASAANGWTITYHPVTPHHWSGPPTDLLSAVDRLAAAVAGLLGTPIP